MLNKPINLSIMINLVFVCSVLVAALLKNCYLWGQFLLILLILFSFSLYIGRSHAKKFKVAMLKSNKIKIAMYYFIFWILLISFISITILKMNPFSFLFLLRIISSKGFYIMLLSIFPVYTLAIYFALGLGSKFGLAKISPNNSQESEPPSQA